MEIRRRIGEAKPDPFSVPMMTVLHGAAQPGGVWSPFARLRLLRRSTPALAAGQIAGGHLDSMIYGRNRGQTTCSKPQECSDGGRLLAGSSARGR